MLKVLHILGGFGKGGVENVLMDLYRTIDKKNFKFDFIVLDKVMGFHEEEIMKLDGNVYHLKCGKNVIFDGIFSKIGFITEVSKIINKNQYGVIHCHNNNLSLLSMIVCFISRIKIRITHSHNASFIKRKSNWLMRLALVINSFFLRIFATHLIGCSESSCIFLFKNYSFLNKKIRIVLNGIDISKFNIKNKKNNIRSIINFLYIGKMTRIKNPIFVIRVFNEIHKKYKNSRLIFIASVIKDDIESRALFSQFKKFISDNDLYSSVEYYSTFFSIPDIMSDSDFFLFPSIAEGLGLVLIEAQSMGLKCIVSDKITKEIDCGLCNFLPIDKGVDPWVERIINLIENGEYTKPTDMNRFDIEVMTKKIEEIYIGADK